MYFFSVTHVYGLHGLVLSLFKRLQLASIYYKSGHLII